MVTATKLRRMIGGFLVAVVGMAALAVTVGSHQSVAALNATRRLQFSQNDILFYDPDGGDNCGGFTSYTAKPTADQITWIGDSYSTMAESIIRSKFPGIDFGGTVNNANSTIQACKFVSVGTTCNANPTNPSGFDILERLISAGQLKPYVVFVLGTNGGWTSSDITRLQEIMSGAPNSKMVLTTSYTLENSYTDSNTRLKDLANANGNYYLADWAAVAQSSYYAENATHPTANGGFTKWVETIYNALPGGSVGILAGNTNEEKVWNYFATAGINNVSNNPAAIAGIMGNFKQESGFNPFSHTSGSSYYGLFQTSAQEMLDSIAAAGLSQYWGRTDAPQSAVDQAMQIELDWLTKKADRFVGTGWASSWGFLKKVTEVSQTPEGMADWFLVAYEGAVACNNGHSGTEILDTVARRIANDVFRCTVYQGASARRENAREIFTKYASTSAQTIVTSQTTSTGMTWSNGWLSGMPGLTKQDVSNASDLGEVIMPGYSTSDDKPNKILLHSTEGTSNGYNAYPAGNKFPAHFIIDLKKKEAYQNLPITDRALASVGADGSSIQIEIVGFSTPSYQPDPNYNLQSFGASEWDYLAVLLSAIAQETGIPLTTSMDWNINYSNTSAVRQTNASDFNNNVTGVVGHMHSPGDTHIDPGNIWPMIQEAIRRNPSAAQFATGSLNSACGPSGATGGEGTLISGGMTLAQAEAFMSAYATEAAKESTGTQVFQGATITDSGCAHGTLNNCSAFTQWFLNKYTTLGPSGAIIRQGSQAVRGYLAAHPELIDGGKVPQVYAIMSMGPYSGAADGWDNHTGIVLGIDVANDQIIIGEASCSYSYRPRAHAYSLSRFTNSTSQYGPTYAYTDAILKGL